MPPRSRSVAVVGNAPDRADHAEAIDAADIVIRFNNAGGFGERTGGRITHLFLVNFGGQPAEWLGDAGFSKRPFVRGANEIVMPFDPGYPLAAGSSEAAKNLGENQGEDQTRGLVARLRRPGRTIRALPASLHDAACRALVISGASGDPIPSTGFLAVFDLLARSSGSGARIDVYGFGFDGWEGHDWNAERRWFEGQASERRLVLHPVQDAPAVRTLPAGLSLHAESLA